MILEKKIPLSYWFSLIKWDLVFLLIFSGILYGLTHFGLELKIQISIAAFLGTAIALLLSFKLSQSYDRWWEARKVWGEIVNDSRTLVIQVKNFSKNQSKEIILKMGYRQIAWCYALGQSLRKLNPLEQSKSFINEEEMQKLNDQKNIPLSLLNFQAADLGKLHQKKLINDFQQIQIDQTLVRLVAAMGKAERIKNTVFPKTYRIILKLILYIFFTLLYLAVAEFTVPLVQTVLVLTIVIPFFLLEKIAFNMQNPFENKPSDTSVTQIARNIEINIKQLLDETPPAALSSDDYFVL